MALQIGSYVEQQWTWMKLVIIQRRHPRKSCLNDVEADTERFGVSRGVYRASGARK